MSIVERDLQDLSGDVMSPMSRDHKESDEQDDHKQSSKLRHFVHGEAGDGIIYVNDAGQKVKLDKRGHPYPVHDDGYRRGKEHHVHKEYPLTNGTCCDLSFNTRRRCMKNMRKSLKEMVLVAAVDQGQ